MSDCVSKATLGRLPIYLQYLRDLPMAERTTVSATAIANALSLGEVQVRKDLASVSGAGKPKIGYFVKDLIADIEAGLGCDMLTNAVLVGAGKLGRTLLDYDGFEEYGVRIVAAFDSNSCALKMDKSERLIYPIAQMHDYCLSNDVRLGIITTGQGSAQEVSDRMVECGIRAILNFAPCKLTVPDGVSVRNENLALSLAVLKQSVK